MRLKRLLTIFMLIALLCGLLPALGGAAGSITGLVFADKQADGLYQEGEALLSGVSVSLVNAADDTQVATAATTDGRYAFPGVAPGQYYLTFELPSGMVPTRFHREGSLAIPSVTGQGRTAPFTVGGDALTVPIGAIERRQTAFVRAIAFGDDNLNGGRYSSEPLLRGVALEVLFELDGTHYQVGTATTDKEGVGTITNIAPGTYRLGATMPGSYIIGPLGSKLNLFYNGIVPSETNYGRSEPFELTQNGSVGMGVGGAKTGSASGFAWDDLNLDGVKDPDEPGAAGVEVVLEHLTMGVERRLMTADDGAFRFPALQPGEYRLTANLGDDRMFTLAGGDSALSSDTARSAQRTVEIHADTENSLGSVGVIPNTALWLDAYHDRNLNGTRDADEPAFAGATLEASLNGQPLGTAVTDAGGAALLPLLRGQPMQLTVSLPDGQIFSVRGDEGGNDFYAATAESKLTIDYALQPGRVSRVSAAITLPAGIGGVLYEDANSNALYDPGETTLGGFTVEAIDASGQVVAQAVTHEDGAYALPRLVPGTYQVRLHLQSPYIFSGAPLTSGERQNAFLDQRADYGTADAITVQAGQVNDNIHGAVFRSGVVRGRVLLGDELSGFDGALGGLPGVLITLLDEDGLEVSQYTVATTDQQGAFLLKGALPGTYSLRYALPGNSAFSKPLTDDHTVTTPAFAVSAGDELEAEPLFAVRTGTYAGHVYLDLDLNGARTESDRPLDSAVISLESDIPENSREADIRPDGSYRLQNLRPGQYTLRVTVPEENLISFDQHGPLSPATGPTNTADVTIAMGDIIASRDVAVVPTHALSGRVYFDNDLSGDRQPDEPGLEGLELKLRHQLSKIEFTAVTGPDGQYAVPVLFPGAYALTLALPEDHEVHSPKAQVKPGALWEVPLTLEPDAGTTAFDLGVVQFGSLSGHVWNLGGTDTDIGGLPITLLDAFGRTLTATATAPDGAWRFDGLYPGQYMLRAQLPPGFSFAREADSIHTRFSLITADASTVRDDTGTSQPFTLLMAQHLENQDIGIGTLGKLGDYAWLDLDRDGMQDAGEPGVPGIVIRLYQYNQQVAEAVTDPWGRYLLSDLYPGQYTMEVTMHPELRATTRQTQFPLVASILPEEDGTTLQIHDITVPSGGRNLNADLGLRPVQDGVLPDALKQLPQRDWTPLVPTVPKRVR